MDGTSVGTYVKSPLSGRMDFFQALTGVILALFTLMHLVFVSTVIISPSIMNGLAWLLEELYLVQIFGPLLFLAMIVHFIIAARKMPFQVGTLPIFIKHSKEMNHVDTWAWLVQVATAIIVLVMASIHMYVIMDSLPISAVESAAREQNGWTPFYLVFLVSVGLHLTIGLFRVGVKFGLITEANRELWKKRTQYLVLGYIALGILAIIRFHFITIG
ncbi:MAG: succinate dehydrogenase/fumarate reductase cytochrome b subunit [Pseudomonadota bacterium]